MSEVSVLIRGTEYCGWLEASVTRSLEALAATFSLTLTDRWGAEQAAAAITLFDRCEIRLDGSTVLDGVIEEVETDRAEHAIRISGHSLTGELDRGEAALPAGELRDVSLAEVARRLGVPQGIALGEAAAGADKVFPRVQIEQGETAADVLAELARQRGLFATDNERGELMLRRRGTKVVADIHGRDAMNRRSRLSGAEVRSEVTVKGQRQGSDRWDVAASAAPVGSARDSSVPLHRPQVILSERQGDSLSLKDRAAFEVARRRGKARRFMLDMPRWTDGSQTLWQVGELYRVTDPWLRLDRAELVLAEGVWSKGKDVTNAELTFGLPEAFDLIEKLLPVREAQGGWVGA